MNDFNKRKIVPIIVILNFVFSFMVAYKLLCLTWRELYFGDWLIVMVGLLLIGILNSVIVITMKKKHGEAFIVSGYIIYLLAIPIISPVIMYCIVLLIRAIMTMLGVGFNMV
ncbi:MAG TPA: hypothetical protein GX736_01380 [Mogibacterium sp.]|nr:hypothetical protein [Mogibacterium sp.]